MNFADYGIQEVVIRNNYFRNVQYVAPGFFNCKKSTQANFFITFQNNSFMGVQNFLAATPLVSLQAP